MKTVVITGSTRGLGYEMAKVFLRNDWNVVINGVNENRLNHAVESLNELKSKSDILGVLGNIANPEDIQNLMSNAVSQFGAVDIWINNAGVNQPSKAIWELKDSEILKDPANDAHINWLTGRKVMLRLMTAPIRKRNFFD